MRWIVLSLLALTGCTGLADSTQPGATSSTSASPAATSSATNSTAPSSAPALTANAVVEHVIDGDTIIVDLDGDEEHVRLIGIDTPEKTIEDRGQVAECFGDEASAFTRALLPDGTELYIERDVEARDDYGRLLGYVYRVDDGIFVNYEIIRQGFAQPLTYAPNVTHSERFVQAARDAERDDVGLWQACDAG